MGVQWFVLASLGRTRRRAVAITLLHLIVGPLSPRLPVISNQYRFQSELNPD